MHNCAIAEHLAVEIIVFFLASTIALLLDHEGHTDGIMNESTYKNG